MTDRIATLSLDPVSVTAAVTQLATHEDSGAASGLNRGSSTIQPDSARRSSGALDVPSFLRADSTDHSADASDAHRSLAAPHFLSHVERPGQRRTKSTSTLGASSNPASHSSSPRFLESRAVAYQRGLDGDLPKLEHGASELLREFILGAENRLVAQGIGIEQDLGLPRTSTGEAKERTRDEQVATRTTPTRLAETQATPIHEVSPLRFDAVPLTIYGAAGYGKSQLLHAICATWIRQQGVDETVFISAVDFARRYANAQKLDELPKMQQRFYRASLLLVDDLDQLRRKPGAQVMLSQIIDQRKRHHRPTVLAIQVAPQFARLKERLISRISSGLVAPLKLPSPSTRSVILQRLCEPFGIQLTEGAQRLLSEQEVMTVPELAGLVTRLFIEHLRTAKITSAGTDSARIDSGSSNSGSPMSGVPNGSEREWVDLNVASQHSSDPNRHRTVTLDVDEVRAALSDRPASEPVDPKKIIREVASYFGISQRQLTGKSRRKMEVQARSIAMYLLRRNSELSFQKIGASFGNRDHSTVMHACEKVAEKLVSDAEMRTSVNELQRRLSA